MWTRWRLILLRILTLSKWSRLFPLIGRKASSDTRAITLKCSANSKLSRWQPSKVAQLLMQIKGWLPLMLRNSSKGKARNYKGKALLWNKDGNRKKRKQLDWVRVRVRVRARRWARAHKSKSMLKIWCLRTNHKWKEASTNYQRPLSWRRTLQQNIRSVVRGIMTFTMQMLRQTQASSSWSRTLMVAAQRTKKRSKTNL